MKIRRMGNYAPFKIVALSLFMLFMNIDTASNATALYFQSQQDSYTQHLRVMNKFYRIFNPDMPVKDVENLCWATWSGCGGDPEAAVWLSLIQALERNFKPETDIGCKVQGYSGQYWYVLITAAQKQGMKRPKVGWRRYFLKHPYEAENRIARWFKEEFYDQLGPWETLAVWHRGCNWKDKAADVTDVRNYRSNILLIYKKFYIPAAQTVTETPTLLDFRPQDGSFLKGVICLVDIPHRAD